jgi:hypothetical protein
LQYREKFGNRSQLSLGCGISMRESGKPHAVLPDVKPPAQPLRHEGWKWSENVEECPKATNWNNGVLAKYRGNFVNGAEKPLM